MIAYMAERLKGILEVVRNSLAMGDARSGEAILQDVAAAYGVTISTLSQFVLYNTTVQAALTALYADSEVCPLIRENHLTWRRSNGIS